nr:hypothetical protein [uncultured Actinoplanes sp.]
MRSVNVPGRPHTVDVAAGTTTIGGSRQRVDRRAVKAFVLLPICTMLFAATGVASRPWAALCS